MTPLTPFSETPRPRASGERPAGLFRRLWRRLIEPHAAIRGADQRRQAALLSATLLVLIGLAVVVEVSTLIVIEWESSYTGYQQTVMAMVLLAVMYAFSRTPRYYIASGGMVAVTSLSVFALGLAQPTGMREGFLDYLALPLWLASLFFGPRAILAVFALDVAGLLLVPQLEPQISYAFVLVGPMSFLLVSTVVLLLMMRQRDLLERDRQAALAAEAARAQALLRVAGRLNTLMELDTLLGLISEEAGQALGLPVAIVRLYDPERDELMLAASAGLSAQQAASAVGLARAPFEQAMHQAGPVLVAEDLRAVAELPGRAWYASLDARTVASAPLEYEAQLIGCLNVMSLGQPRAISQDERLLLRGLADQAALAIVNTRLYKDARRRLEHLQALRAIDVAIATHHDLRQTLNVLLEQIMGQLTVDAAVVLLRTVDELDYAASRGFRTPALQFTRLRLGQGNAGLAAQTGEIVHIPDLRAQPQRFAPAPLLAQEDFITYHAAPLLAQGQVTGVLEVFHRSPFAPNAEWWGFLETLAGQAAIAIDNTALFSHLQQANAELARAYDATIEGWSRALDLRDKETEGHTQRVTEMTLRLAREMGLPEAELVHVRRGALLHDIGKMGIPDRILLKPGPLTDEEWTIMQQHPVFANAMLAPIAYLRPALDIPYCHHEKWDGTGYPRGLKGEAIPLAARLFAVVDVWDALRSDRPYRPAWPLPQVLTHLETLAGTHFDPQVVPVFLRLLEANAFPAR